MITDTATYSALTIMNDKSVSPRPWRGETRYPQAMQRVS